MQQRTVRHTGPRGARGGTIKARLVGGGRLDSAELLILVGGGNADLPLARGGVIAVVAQISRVLV